MTHFKIPLKLAKNGMTAEQLFGARWFMDAANVDPVQLTVRFANPSWFHFRFFDWLDDYNGDIKHSLRVKVHPDTDLNQCIRVHGDSARWRRTLFNAFSLFGETDIDLIAVPMCGVRTCVNTAHAMLLTEDEARQFILLDEVRITDLHIDAMLRLDREVMLQAPVTKPERVLSPYCMRGHEYPVGVRKCKVCFCASEVARKHGIDVEEALWIPECPTVRYNPRRCPYGHDRERNTRISSSGKASCRRCDRINSLMGHFQITRERAAELELLPPQTKDMSPMGRQFSNRRPPKERKLSPDRWRPYLEEPVIRRVLTTHDATADYEAEAMEIATRKTEAYMKRVLGTGQHIKSISYKPTKLKGGSANKKVNMIVVATVEVYSETEMMAKRTGIHESLLEGAL